ncbi:MAG: exodeoxyribonuclease VII large subunit [Phycisphaerales bacterium]
MTGRLPFDPLRATGAPEPERVAAQPLTVTQLSRMIQSALERHVESPVLVRGEVSNVSVRGHSYFTLKDQEAVLPCVAWASDVKRFTLQLRDGMEVVASGSVSHYPPQGRTQFYVKSIREVGAGGLDAKFRALCEEFRKAGAFDESRKRQLPPYPQRVGIITSANGAALQDVITTAKQRWPAVGLCVIDTRVQGQGAAEDIVRAIRAAVNATLHPLDAIILTRGGGSLEDLWAFNERIVADAVLACTLPIVAAIGHESDTTIAELVADVRASTPTQAVMLAIPARADLDEQLRHLQHRMHVALDRTWRAASQRLAMAMKHECMRVPSSITRRASERLSRLQEALTTARKQCMNTQWLRLERLQARLAACTPKAITQRSAMQVENFATRLTRAMRAQLRNQLTTLNHFEQQLRSVKVQRVLQRGYSYTTLVDGSIMRSVNDATAGDLLQTHLADGSIRSVVGTEQSPSNAIKQPPRKPARKSTPARPGQLDLFGDAG